MGGCHGATGYRTTGVSRVRRLDVVIAGHQDVIISSYQNVLGGAQDDDGWARVTTANLRVATRSREKTIARNEEVRMKFDPLIFRRVFATLLLLGAVVVILSMAHPLRGQTTNSSIVTSLQYSLGLLSLLPGPGLDPVLDPPGNFHAVQPFRAEEESK